MANKILVTPLGSPIISDDTAMTQSDKIPICTMVESLAIEFDHEKYEEFLSSNSTSPKSLRKYHMISMNLVSHEAQKTTCPKTLKT